MTGAHHGICRQNCLQNLNMYVPESEEEEPYAAITMRVAADTGATNSLRALGYEVQRLYEIHSHQESYQHLIGFLAAKAALVLPREYCNLTFAGDMTPFEVLAKINYVTGLLVGAGLLHI